MKKNISNAEKRKLSSESRARKRERRQLGLKTAVVQKNNSIKKLKTKKAENTVLIETVKNLQMSLQFKSNNISDKELKVNDALTKSINIHSIYNEKAYRELTYYGQGMMANYRNVG